MITNITLKDLQEYAKEIREMLDKDLEKTTNIDINNYPFSMSLDEMYFELIGLIEGIEIKESIKNEIIQEIIKIKNK